MINLFALIALSVVQSAPLTATAPIVVPGGAGKFDFMNFDPATRSVFACHPPKSSFAVVSLDSGKVKSVDTGVAVNGIDADGKGKKVFAAGQERVWLSSIRSIGGKSENCRSADPETPSCMTRSMVLSMSTTTTAQTSGSWTPQP